MEGTLLFPLFGLSMHRFKSLATAACLQLRYELLLKIASTGLPLNPAAL